MTYRVALRLLRHCSVPRSAGEGGSDTPLEDGRLGGRLEEGMPTQEQAKIDGERDYRQYMGG